MNDFCPLKNSKEFKELESIFGKDEAYLLWKRNEGQPLDTAPNGEPSQAYRAALELFGDRQSALKAMGAVVQVYGRRGIGNLSDIHGNKYGWSVKSIYDHLVGFMSGRSEAEIKTHVKDTNEIYGTNFGVYTDKDTNQLVIKYNTKPFSELKLSENPYDIPFAKALYDKQVQDRIEKQTKQEAQQHEAQLSDEQLREQEQKQVEDFGNWAKEICHEWPSWQELTVPLNNPEFSEFIFGLNKSVANKPVASGNETQMELGVNKEQLIALLGSTMYKANVQEVAVKELIQNAFDAVKIAKSQGSIQEGNINLTLDSNNRTVTVEDNGLGMSPEIVQKAFFTIGGSYKGDNVDNKLKSGGLGFAKMAFLFSSDYIEVSTVKNGVKTYVRTTPDELQSKEGFKVYTSKTDEPNGTKVTVRIPESYTDNNGEEKRIYFDNNPDFLSKPMIGDVSLTVTKKTSYSESTETFNKNKIPEGFTYIGNATTIFGELKIYVKELTGKYEQEWVGIKVLISGLYQFNDSVRVEGGRGLEVIVDILPSVGVKSQEYPINNQREGFRGTVEPEVKDLKFLLSQISSTLASKSITAAFNNSISMDIDDVSVVRKKDESQNKIKDTVDDVWKTITQKALQDTDRDSSQKSDGNSLDFRAVRSARKVTEKDRRSSFRTDISLNDDIQAIDTSKMDVNKPIFHNNTSMEIEEDGKQFLNKLAQLLMEVKSLYIQTYKGQGINCRFGDVVDYLNKQFWGFSFDKDYGGVNVSPKVMPFLAINPFYNLPRYEGVDAALQLVAYVEHLIIHEFNHNFASGEGAGFTGRFPMTYAEFYGIGRQYTKDWRNKLYILIRDNLDVLQKYEKRYKQSVNLGESFEQNKFRSVESSKNSSTETNGEQSQRNSDRENVSQTGERLGEVLQAKAKELKTNKKPYVSPSTQRKSFELEDDVMANTSDKEIAYPLEDNSANIVQSEVERIREYLDNISNELMKAFELLQRAYKNDKTTSVARQRTKNRVHELINKLQEVQGEAALKEVLQFGIKSIGILPNNGQNVDEKTVLGFLYKSKRDTDGRFTNITPDQIQDIYKNAIGFYEKTLLPLLPNLSDLAFDQQIIQDIEVLQKSVQQAKILWAEAMEVVGRRVVDGAIQQQVVASQEVKDRMKEVAGNWLTLNTYYGDISVWQTYTANFGQMENPIIRIGFHLIQQADTKTLETIHPIAAKLVKQYRKADHSIKRYFKTNWQKALMELDRNGIPTGRFVSDINYGQYENDLNNFVSALNADWEHDYGFHYVRDEYGYIVRSDTGERADNQVWVGNTMPNYYEYQLQIEKWKSDHAERMYTFNYYKERMSKPYRGFEDPALLPSNTKLDGHGLSPKTLAAYQHIQSNINQYLQSCADEETGLAHPERLSPEDKLKLDEWYDRLDDIQNPYNADGTVKPREEMQMAFELRAWQRWIGERTETHINQKAFDEELEKVKEQARVNNNDRLVTDFLRYNTRVDIHPDYFAQTIGRFSEAKMEDVDVVHARLVRASLQNLLKSRWNPVTKKQLYTKEIGLMQNKASFFSVYKEQDQIIADGRTKSDKDYFEAFNNAFRNIPIIYVDEYGEARTKSGAVADINTTDPRELMTWYEYLKQYYIKEAKRTGTLPGYYDDAGNQKPVTGTDDEIEAAVNDLLTYTDTYWDSSLQQYVSEVKPLTVFSILYPTVDMFKHPQTGKLTPTVTEVPRGLYADKCDRTGDFINMNFDKSNNHAEQPKRRMYDNSEAMRKLEEDGLKDIYDLCISTMQESHAKHSPRTSNYDLQLPRMNAKDGAIASRILQHGFRKTAQDIIKSMKEAQANDTGMLTENMRIKSPDGTIGTTLPLRYVGKLEDPSTYTTDIVAAVIMYAHMAENYKNKQIIEGQLNTLAYNLDSENREAKGRKGKRGERTYNDDSNSEKAFRAMLNSGLYDNRWDVNENFDVKEPSEFGTAVKNILATAATFGTIGGSLGLAGGVTGLAMGAGIGAGVGAVIGLATAVGGKISSNKLARAFQRTESLQMLGFNILSMVVGLGDSLVKMTRDSLCGKYMTPRDLAVGVGNLIKQLPFIIQNMGNPLANCKTVAMMQLNGVSKDTERIYSRTGKGRTRNIISNICLGGFSMLDYGANSILLRAHYNNVRYYKGNPRLGISPGWYSRYELNHAFRQAGGSKLDFEIAYASCGTTLWDAYEFVDNVAVLRPEYSGEHWGEQQRDGTLVIHAADPNKTVSNKLKTLVRTKTIQRGALYNGMNPDNDIPLYKRSIYGSMIGAMRGWLTQQVQHLFYGLDDTSIREDVLEERREPGKSKIKHGVERQIKYLQRKARTPEQRQQRMTWNYETGVPQDEIIHGLRRSFNTLLRKAIAIIRLDGKALKDAKLSYVERYAWRDTIATLGITAALMVAWPSVHNWAKSAHKPENREEAGATGPIDAVTRYIPDVYFGEGVYKMTIDDIFFRIIESQLTGFDPKTTTDIVNALSVYKSATEEQLGIMQNVGDVAGFTGHSTDEVINRGSYKYYTRGEKYLYKVWTLGQLDNLHTALTYNGLQSNLNFYYHQYGWIYKAFGWDDFKNQQQSDKTSKFGKKGFGKKKGQKKGFGKKKF